MSRPNRAAKRSPPAGGQTHWRHAHYSAKGRAAAAPLNSGAPAVRVLEGKKGKNMPLITLVITLIVVGVLLWLTNTYIPMDGKIKKVLNIVVMVVVVFWLLNVFGVWGYLRNVRVSRDAPALVGSVRGAVEQGA